MSPDDFISRWQPSGASERANYQSFLLDLCDMLGVGKPDPKTPFENENAYVSEKSIPLPHGKTGAVDLYKRGHFILEAKQGGGQGRGDRHTLGRCATAQEEGEDRYGVRVTPRQFLGIEVNPRAAASWRSCSKRWSRSVTWSIWMGHTAWRRVLSPGCLVGVPPRPTVSTGRYHAGFDFWG